MRALPSLPSLKVSLNALLVLLLFTVLWKGGKSLESTWLLTAVAGMCVLSLWYAQRNQPFRLGVSATLWWSCMLFVVWTAITYLLSTTRNYGLDEVLREGSLFLLLPVLSRVLPTEEGSRWVDRLLRVMVWTTLAACAIGGVVYVLQPVSRMVGTFFDYRFQTDYWPNAWAEYLLLAWPVTALWVTQAAGRARTWRLLVLGVVLGCLLLSYSRGAALAFCGQLLLLAFIQGTRVHRGWREGGALPSLRRMSLLIAVPFVTAVVTFAGVNAARSQIFPVQSVLQKVTFTAAEGASSKYERAQFWRQAWQLALERPITGYGPYSFRFVQPKLQEGVLQTSDHPHNVFLKLAMERGFPSLLLFLLILVSALLPVMVRQFSPERLRQTGLQRESVLLVAVLGVLAHLMIDYNLQFVGIILPFVLFLAILAAGDRREARIALRRRVVAVEILLAVLLLCVAVSETRELVLSSLGRRAEVRGQPERALAWYELADGEWFSRDLLLSQAHIHLVRKEWDLATQALNTYERENSQDYRSQKLRAELLLAQGQREAAAETLEQALHRALWNDLSVLRLLLNLQPGQGQTQSIVPREAVLLAAHAYERAILNNEHFIGLSPNADEFLLLADRAAVLWPQDAAELQTMRRNVRQSITALRATMHGRQPGFLW